MIRTFFFLFGICLMIYSFSYLIVCLNVINIGYNFSFYVNFIVMRFSTYLWIIGFLIVMLTFVLKGDMRK